MPQVIIPEKLEPIVNYIVQGSEHQFTFKFFVVRTDDLFVYVNDKLVDKNNYTVTGIDNPQGGYVDINKNLQPLVKGDQVTLFRFTLPEQLTEFIRLGDFTAVAVNAEFNRLYALMQELRRDALTRYDDDEQEVEGHVHFEDITFEYTGKPDSPVQLKDYQAKISALQAEDSRIESESKSRDYSQQLQITKNADDIKWLGGKLGANLPVLPWIKGGEAVNPFQRYMFLTDPSSPAYGFTYNAPSATKKNPVIMGDTPAGDGNWHQWDVSQDDIDRLKNDINQVESDLKSISGVDEKRFSSLKEAVEFAIKNQVTLNITRDIEVSESVYLDGDLIVRCGKSKIKMKGTDYVFIPNGGDYLEIEGGRWSASEYLAQRPQVVKNGYNQDKSKYLKRIKISNPETFNCGLCCVVIDGRNLDAVDIDINGWRGLTDDKTDEYIAASSIAPGELIDPYVQIEVESDQSIDIGTPRVSGFKYFDNKIDAHMQSGDNEDIAKFTGSLKSGCNVNNYFENRNLNSAAEVDTFTGGLGGVIGHNHFKNTSLKQMTLKGALAPRIALGGLSAMSGNIMLFEPNNKNFYAILTRTSFANVSNNIIDYFGADDVANQENFTALLFGPLDNNENGFGGTNPAALTVNGNVVRISLSDLHTNTRVHTIDPSLVVGSSFAGNVLIGGNDNVLNPRPENTTNIWSGNQFYSKLFTVEGIWRMQACFTGVGNRISTHVGQSDAQDPMAVKIVPDWAYDTPVLLTLDLNIKTTFPNDGTLFYLHVMSKDGHVPNKQTFIVSSGDHADSYQGIEAIDNLIDPNTAIDNEKACVFTAGYKGDGYIQIKAKLGYRDGGVTPKNVYYMIECISNNFKGVKGI